jgi:hypothetical protein
MYTKQLYYPHILNCSHVLVAIVFMGYLVAGSGDLDLDLDQRTGQLGAVHTCQPVLAIRKTQPKQSSQTKLDEF